MEKEKSCLSCKHEYAPTGCEPCVKCCDKNLWEPKDEEMPDVRSVEGEPCEISTEREGSWGSSPLEELLFDYTRKALNEFKIAQAEADSCKEQPDAWKYRAEREIKRQRFSALWDVIEAATLEEEYEKWTRQPETLPY